MSEPDRARIRPMRIRALLAEAAIQHAEVVLVCAADCAPERGAIDADVWRDGAWRRERRDRLDVVVCSGVPTTAQQRSVVAWLESRFPVIRPSHIGKSDLPGLLRAPTLANRLPPQAILPADGAARAIEDFARAHSGAVVKPSSSRGGRGVVFIVPDGDGWLRLTDDQAERGDLSSLAAEIADGLAGRLRYRQFLLQKFIRSTTADGRGFAIRIDLHKDVSRGWTLVAAAAVIGRRGPLVVNLSQGGFYGDLTGALGDRRVRSPDAIVADAVETTVAAAEALDRDPAISLRELGVDLAIDERDALWILDVNLHPGALCWQLRRAAFDVAYCLAAARGEVAVAGRPSPATGAP